MAAEHEPAPAAHTAEVIALGDETRPAHSPLGASSAERWMNCPGSNLLLKELRLPESDDPSFRNEGTAMHAAAEHCLNAGVDSWETVGLPFGDEGQQVEITPEMGDGVQMYVDLCRADMATALESYVEMKASSPLHPSMFGTMDFGAVFGVSNLTKKPFPDPGPKPKGFYTVTRVVVRDLKGGEGIVVDPDDNPQLKYYAFLLIDQNPDWDDEVEVSLEIVQPRAFSQEGPHRKWPTTVGAIREWVHSELLPAMHRAEMDKSLDAGDWCRFCPAKLVCPLMTSLFRAAATANPLEVIHLSDESIGRSYQYTKAVKHYLKALEDDVYRRLNSGVVMEGQAKLVKKKSNRVYNPGAPAEAKAKFGDEAMTKPELLSPAALEKISPAAKLWVQKNSHQPDTGETVALWDDPRGAVKVTTSKEAFGSAVAALLEKQE